MSNSSINEWLTPLTEAGLRISGVFDLEKVTEPGSYHGDHGGYCWCSIVRYEEHHLICDALERNAGLKLVYNKNYIQHLFRDQEGVHAYDAPEFPSSRVQFAANLLVLLEQDPRMDVTSDRRRRKVTGIEVHQDYIELVTA